jgi:hypothetical protein
MEFIEIRFPDIDRRSTSSRNSTNSPVSHKPQTGIFHQYQSSPVSHRDIGKRRRTSAIERKGDSHIVDNQSEKSIRALMIQQSVNGATAPLKSLTAS